MSRFADGPMEPPKQYSARSSVEQQFVILQRELAMVSPYSEAWFRKMVELQKMESILGTMRR